MMKHVSVAVGIVTLLCGTCTVYGSGEIKNQQDRVNYSVGYQIGGDFRRQGIALSAEALIQGIRDGLARSVPAMPSDEMRTTLMNLKKRIVADQRDDAKQAAVESRLQGKAFLQENGKKEGVNTLPSGVQYRVVNEGTGKKPAFKDNVTVNFRSSLPSGTELDSTYRDNKPRTYPLDKAVPGLKEVFPMMKEGAKWQIVIPADLAFGDRSPLAEQASAVIYEMELVSVQPVQ